MAIDLTIPGVGESITEVQIAEWLKKEGDEVQKDENVAVIDSQKTTLELPAPESGRLKILRQAGETVPIGEVVARIETNGEPAKTDPARKPEKAEKPAPPKETPPPAAATGAVTPPEKAAAKPDKKEPPVIPAAEAKKTTPPALPVAGTPGAGEKVAPMTMLRRTAAKRLVEAKQQMAMLTTFNEVDTSAVQGLRKEFQEKFEKRTRSNWVSCPSSSKPLPGR